MENAATSQHDLHVFMRNGTFLGIHGKSMKVFTLDEPSYRFLRLLEEGCEPAAAETRLVPEYGMTRSAEIAAGFPSFLEDLIADVQPRMADKRDGPLVAENLMLLAAEDCNLKCDYCFAGQGSYGRAARRMDSATAFRAVDFVVDNGLLASYCIVCYFGGEPMLAYDLVKEVTVYARRRIKQEAGRLVGFSLTTNGTILTPAQMDFLLVNDIAVMISIDGTPELHDLYRKTKSGQGTFTRVAANSSRLIGRLKDSESKTHLVGRPTLTAHEPDPFKLFAYMEGLGFEHVIIEPVSTDPHEDMPFAVGDEHVETFVRGYQRVCEAMRASILAQKGCAYSQVGWILSAIHHRQPKQTSCNAGMRYFTVDARGDIYPCQRRVGLSDQVIGSVWQGIDEERRQSVLPPPVDARPPCSTCWTRYFCGGGCPAESFRYYGADKTVIGWRCRMYQGVVESCAWLYSELARAGAEALNHLIETQRPWQPGVLE